MISNIVRYFNADGTPTTRGLEYFRGLEAGGGAGGGAVSWGDVTGKPSTFTPSAHSHAIGDVTGLQAALDGKQAADESSPVFTYSGGDVVRVDYASGNYKTLAYTSGVLTQIDYVRAGLQTIRKMFNYNPDGTLASVTETLV